MRTSCSSAANHPSLPFPNPNPQVMRKKTLTEIGGSAPKPLGFTAFAPRYMPLTGFRKGAYCDAPLAPTSQPPSRRSGRIPALPYPPPGSPSISDETLSGMNNILNARTQCYQSRRSVSPPLIPAPQSLSPVCSMAAEQASSRPGRAHEDSGAVPRL